MTSLASSFRCKTSKCCVKKLNITCFIKTKSIKSGELNLCALTLKIRVMKMPFNSFVLDSNQRCSY